MAQAVGVDEETALQGMLNAPADPGAVKLNISMQIAQKCIC